MHLSRDTHNLLNESIRSVSLEEDYDILTEEQFNEAYEDFVDFLAENYTDEELENMTEEELIEGFLSRLTGATGTLVGKVKRGVKSAGSTWEDMKKQYHRGVAGELTWTGAEKYPSDEDSSKTEKTEEEPTAEKKTKTPKPKVSPEQKNKLATDPRHDALRKRREARKQSGDDLAMSLRQRLQSKGLISDKGKKTEAGKAAATNVKDKAAAISAKTKETIVNKKRGAAYSKCIEKGGDEKKCMKYASSIMASKEYYSDLRKRLLENYKK